MLRRCACFLSQQNTFFEPAELTRQPLMFLITFSWMRPPPCVPCCLLETFPFSWPDSCCFIELSSNSLVVSHNLPDCCICYSNCLLLCLSPAREDLGPSCKTGGSPWHSQMPYHSPCLFFHSTGEMSQPLLPCVNPSPRGGGRALS